MSEETERADMRDDGWFPVVMLGIASFSGAALLYFVARLVHLIPA